MHISNFYIDFNQEQRTKIERYIQKYYISKKSYEEEKKEIVNELQKLIDRLITNDYEKTNVLEKERKEKIDQLIKSNDYKNPSDRIKQIKKWLEDIFYFRVEELSKIFNLSPKTIQKDMLRFDRFHEYGYKRIIVGYSINNEPKYEKVIYKKSNEQKILELENNF